MRWSPIAKTLGEYEVSERGVLRRLRDGFKPTLDEYGSAMVALRVGRLAINGPREACIAFHRHAVPSCLHCYPEVNSDHFWRSKDLKVPHTPVNLRAAHERYVGKGTCR